jgi:hypothetical protein
MNTTLENPVAGAHFARTPERCLLVGPDAAWCERTLAILIQRAGALPQPSFLAWRLAHGLIRVVPLSAVNAELTQALSDTQDSTTQRNATRVWATTTAEDWYAQTRDCTELQKSSARGLNVTLLPLDDSGAAVHALEGFVRAVDAPDALPRLSWLMSDRPMPVPSEWLCLAPLAELSEAQNAAMASEGQACYKAWAEEVLAFSDPDEMQALWGPYPDDETPEDDREADNVVDMQAEREQRASLASLPRWGEASGRMAASSGAATASSELDALLEPAFSCPLESTVSRGATGLKAFCYPPEEKEGSLPRVALVASWNDSRKMVGRPEDLCLVLTLSKRKPVLLRGEPDPSDPLQVRFQWPSERWPEDIPRHPQAIKRWLADHLPKARVSLQ